MLLDTSAFPLVWMRNAPSPEPVEGDGAFGPLEQLLRRGETFVLLTEAGGFEDHEHSGDDKKKMSLWMKRHRAELKMIKGMIAIEPSVAKRLAMKPFSLLFKKFWGYPLLFAGAHDEAIEVARKLLGGVPAETFSAAE